MTAQKIIEGRPDMRGETTRTETPIGTAYITVNFHNSQPLEVFITLGKNGAPERAAAEAIGRLLSVSLQRGVSLKVLTDQLKGVSSEATMGLGPNKILSMPDAVARVLERYT